MAGITPRIRVPASAAPGEIVEVKTLISHPMETGRRRDAEGGLVPRRIITRFTAAFEGESVLEIEVEPVIAANPFFAFSFRVPGPGTLKFTWTDETGAVWVEEQAIALA